MSARYTQSKGEAAKHSEILKTMLKRPENKLCADCKRNDPRWASTNLGCFMCIRCSGIHRGMGVHITRIKSVDLDTWSPEQIVNIQRWGNRRANAYWEAHLKPGHMPPEHKMESFIRSKYETKRWAMEGPMPEPETLDEDDTPESAPPVPAQVPKPSASRIPPPTASVPAPATRKSNPLDLLATPPTSSSTLKLVAAPTATTPSSGAGGGLFELDFSSPAAASAPAVKKDAKADILSLFASAPPPPPVQQQQQHTRQSSFGMGGLSLGGGVGAGVADPWGAPAQVARAPQVPAGGGGGGGWGNFESFGGAQSPPVVAKPSNDLFAGSATNVWGSSSSSTTASADPFGAFASGGTGGTGSGTKKQSDAFSDIWA